MSTVGLPSEVRFSDSTNPVAVFDSSGRTSAMSSSSRTPLDDTPPHSIPKTKGGMQCWLHSRPNDEEIDTTLVRFSQSMLTGRNQWLEWRTQLNGAMVDLICKRHWIVDSYPRYHGQKYHDTMNNSLNEPVFLIGPQASEFALQRAGHDHVTGRAGSRLRASTYISFGLPRVKLCTNTTYIPDYNSPTKSPKTGSSHTVTDSPRSKSVSDYSEDGTQPALPIDKTVVIVSFTEGSSPRKSGEHEVVTDTLCAVLDLTDDPDSDSAF